MTCDLESYIVAVERIEEYVKCPQEAAAVIDAKRPDRTWPETGTVQMNKYSTRYRPGLDLVLKGVTCTVQSNEKV